MRHITTLTAAACSALLLGSIVTADDIPDHPDALTFEPLHFDAPVASDYRRELSNGVPVYMAPSHELPLVRITLTFKGGEYLGDPAVAGMLGALMRQGGTTTMSPEELDEALDFLATTVSTGCGADMSTAALDCLSATFDKSMALFMDIVRNPGLDEDRFELQKTQALEAMKQRNDSADSILDREWSGLVYGHDHHAGRQPTADDITGMTLDDLRAMHARIFHPGNLIVAISGDFEPDAMLARLETAFAGWTAAERNSDPPAPTATMRGGIYHVEKDIPQGKVYIGLRGIVRDDPDAVPMMLMNQILGGGGFTSRIMQRVRTDEGLAYSAGSVNDPEVYYPGQFRVSFQSKSSTVALATKICMEEIDRIRTQPVPADELEKAKANVIQSFPQRFGSRAQTLGMLVRGEMTNLPADHWQTYRDRVEALSADDLMAIANRVLTPENMAIFVVGRWDEIYAGDIDGRATMADFFGGEVTHVPLKDPLTLQPK